MTYNDIEQYQIPRMPTTDELDQLARFTAEEQGRELELVQSDVGASYIVVFDEYLPIYPDYAKKVMLVIWDSSADGYEAFTWQDDGTLCSLPQARYIPEGHIRGKKGGRVA